MQAVSTAWKTAQKQSFTPPSYVEIIYAITDPALISRYTPSSTNQAHFSNLPEVFEEIDKSFSQFVTLEHGIWPLDGNMKLLAPPYGNTGFVSNTLCNESARFTTPVTITILFERVLVQPIPGLTITWSSAYDEMSREFTLTAYLNGAFVNSTTITNNTELSNQVNFDVRGYNRIDIQIKEWCLPYRRARIEDITIGFYALFNNANIFQLDHTNSADPLGSYIPENTLVFKIDNTDQDWNPANPQGMYKFLLEQQEITARYGYEINGTVEWIPAGVFYLSEWDTPQNSFTATFTARNSFELMQDIYTGTLNGTLYDIAIAALTQADLPPLSNKRVRWIVDNRLKNYTVVTEEPFEASISEILQLCAHAASCGLTQDRYGTVRIEPITLGIDSKITSTSGAPFSDLSRLGEPSTFSLVAVNELGSWGLNGQFEIITGNSTFPFVSNALSDASARFASPPSVSIELVGEQRYSPAVMITWSNTYGEMATAFNVKVRLGSTIVETITITNNTELSNAIHISASNFDRITVEIVEWCLPYHRAKMERLSFAPDYVINPSNSRPETNISVTRELRRLIVNRGLASIANSETGFIQEVYNPFIATQQHALEVGNEIKGWLSRRNRYLGDYRADPRLDPLDTVLVNNKYADKVVVIDNIKFSYSGGAFWGWYSGREWS